MGADTSRFYASTEDSGDLDSYIKRGGARLVNRERQLTTSTTLHLGGVDGAGEEAGEHRVSTERRERGEGEIERECVLE